MSQHQDEYWPRHTRRPSLNGVTDPLPSLNTEHRLTKLEVMHEAALARVSRLEKVGLALFMAFQVVLHHAIPDWAKYLAVLVKAMG